MNYSASNQFIHRVIRSVKIRSGHLLVRFKYIFGLRKHSDLLLKIYPWPDLAGLPGNSEHLPWGKCWQHDNEMMPLAVEIISHHFSIFKDQLLDVSIVDPERKALIAKQCPGVDQRILDSYIPIDWHQDFHSHYRWPPHLFFQDVKMAPFPGVEIKVPRELSRFQHVGALAYGDQKRSSIEFMLQATDWIVSNPYGLGVNWASSMDVALRAINWIWGLRFFEPEIQKHEPFQRLIANSLRDHGLHIYENQSYYGEEIPTGNHYLAEIVGLVFIGAALSELPEADLWLAFGIHELVSEMKRQVLVDGMCHEASISYHRLVTELFVSAAALIERLPDSRRQRLFNFNIRSHSEKPLRKLLADSQVNLTSGSQILPESFYVRLELMAEFSLSLRKPNGFVCQIGDNDSGRVHKLFPSLIEETLNHDHLFSTIGELLGRNALIKAGSSAQLEGKLVCGGVRVNETLPEKEGARSLGIQIFPYAGIASHRKGKAWLGVSCGASGLSGNGGHGHNDKNSFELNVNQLDFVVDGGCPYYTSFLNLRNKFRSTFAHNTVAVLRKEQNKLNYSLYGVCLLKETSNPSLEVRNGTIIKGMHYGFGRPHSRTFELKYGSLEIIDYLEEESEQFLLFNLHPDILCSDFLVSDCLVQCTLAHKTGTKITLKMFGVAQPVLEPGFFSSGYAQIVSTRLISARRLQAETKTTFEWHE